MGSISFKDVQFENLNSPFKPSQNMESKNVTVIGNDDDDDYEIDFDCEQCSSFPDVTFVKDESLDNFSFWESEELFKLHRIEQMKLKLSQGANNCMMRLEQPAFQSLEVAVDILSFPLLMSCYLNIAELRLLQGLPAASQLAWTEACQLILSNFLFCIPCVKAREVLFSKMPISLLVKLNKFLKRIIRLLFCYAPNFIQKHVLLLDMFVEYQNLLFAYINKDPSFSKNVASLNSKVISPSEPLSARNSQITNAVGSFKYGSNMRSRIVSEAAQIKVTATDSSKCSSKQPNFLSALLKEDISKGRPIFDSIELPPNVISHNTPNLHGRKIFQQRFKANQNIESVEFGENEASLVNAGYKIAALFQQMETNSKQYGQNKINQVEARDKNLSILRSIFKYVNHIKKFSTDPISSNLLRFEDGHKFDFKFNELLRTYCSDSDLKYNVLDTINDFGFSKYHVSPFTIIYPICIDNIAYLYSPSTQTLSFSVSPLLNFRPEFSPPYSDQNTFISLDFGGCTPNLRHSQSLSIGNLFPTSETVAFDVNTSSVLKDIYDANSLNYEDIGWNNNIPPSSWFWQLSTLKHFYSTSSKFNNYADRTIALQSNSNAGLSDFFVTSSLSSSLNHIENQLLKYIAAISKSNIIDSKSFIATPYSDILLARLPNVFSRCANPIPLNMNSAHEVFKLLDSQNIIHIFSALFAEQKIIFCSSYPHKIMASIYTFVSLMYPFYPAHMIIPLIQTESIGLLGLGNYEAKCHFPNQPYILGMPAELMSTISIPIAAVLVNLDHNIVQYQQHSFPPLPTTLKNRIYKILIKFMGATFITNKPDSSHPPTPKNLTPAGSSKFTHDSSSSKLGSPILDNKLGSPIFSELAKDNLSYVEELDDKSANPYMDISNIKHDSAEVFPEDKSIANDLGSEILATYVEMFAKYLLCWTPPSIESFKPSTYWDEHAALDSDNELCVKLGFNLNLYIENTPHDQKNFMKRFLRSMSFAKFLESRLLALYLLNEKNVGNSKSFTPDINSKAISLFKFERLCRQNLSLRHFSISSSAAIELSCHLKFARKFDHSEQTSENKLSYSRRWAVLHESTISIFRSKKDEYPEYVYPLEAGHVRINSLHNASGFEDDDFPFELVFSVKSSPGLLKAHTDLVERRDANKGFFSFDFSFAKDKEIDIEACGNIVSGLSPAKVCLIVDSDEMKTKWLKALRARVLDPVLVNGYLNNLKVSE